MIPVFGTQEYAHYLEKTGNYSTIWFYGFANSSMQFILPFAVNKRNIFKIGVFLTASICVDENVNTETEREFLNSVIMIIKQEKLCDWIAQPANWALFRVVPTGSIYCEFGTYRIDLLNSNEDELFQKINYHHKRLIKKAQDNNVIVKSGLEVVNDCGNIFMAAAARGNHTLLSKNELKLLFDLMPELVNTNVSYNNLVPQSSIVYFANKFCLYVVYIGNFSSSSLGENHLLHWLAIKDAKTKGIRYFDFVGARINPDPGSKQEGIQKFKKYFGGEFVEGFLWKLPINRSKYYLYKLFIKTYYFLRGEQYFGDIIDQELKK